MGPEEPGDPYSGSRKATGASGHTGNTTSISIIKMRHLTHLISQNSKVKKCGVFSPLWFILAFHHFRTVILPYYVICCLFWFFLDLSQFINCRQVYNILIISAIGHHFGKHQQ